MAGAYSADNVLTVLDNMNKGMRMATLVLLEGFSPFCPWLDYQFKLMAREGEVITLEDYYRYSMAFLEVCDAVLVVPGYEKSKGTLAEIARAKELKMPVVYSLHDLKRLRGDFRYRESDRDYMLSQH